MVLNQPLYGRHHPTAQPFCAMSVVNTSSKPFVFWRCFIRMDSLSSFHPSEKGKYPLKVGNSFFTYLTDSLNLAPDFQRKHSRVWRSPKPHLWAQYKWEPLKSNSCTFKLPRSLQMRAEDRLKESKWTSWKILSETKHTKKDPISMKKLRLLSQPWTPSSNYWVFQHLLKVNTIFQSKNCGWRTLAEGHLPKKKKEAEAATDQPLSWLQLWHCCLWWEPGCQIGWSQAIWGFMNANTVESLEGNHESQVRSKAAVMPMSRH